MAIVACDKVHPLLAGETTYINNWAEWKELWRSTSLAELRHSLLHFGFDVPAEYPLEWVERVCFYLEVADGYRESSEFRKKGEEGISSLRTSFGREVYDFAALRKVLADKAFEILAAKFFAQAENFPNGELKWLKETVKTEILEKTVWFFRPNGFESISNLSRSETGENHSSRLARKFLLSLCEAAFRPADTVRQLEGVLERIKDLRPQLVEILNGLRALDMLLRSGAEVDALSMAKLKSLAMDEKHHIPPFLREYRKPKSLEEACLLGSKAARVLILLRIITAEQEKVTKERKLNQKIEEIKSQLEKLS